MPERPELLLDQAHFDGRLLSGRALIRAGSKNTTILPYAIPTFVISIYGVSPCDDGEGVGFINPAIIGFCDPLKDPCDPFVLRNNHYFGGRVEFVVSTDGPEECVDVHLQLFLFDKDDRYGPPGIVVRAHRDGPVETIDADSCPAPRPPAGHSETPEEDMEH